MNSEKGWLFIKDKPPEEFDYATKWRIVDPQDNPMLYVPNTELWYCLSAQKRWFRVDFEEVIPVEYKLQLLLVK